MANDLLKQAIADAKAVRETALANAKLALEEAFTPKIQSMLSNRIAEEEDMEEGMHGDDEKNEGMHGDKEMEEGMHGDKEMEEGEHADMVVTKKEEDMEEDMEENATSDEKYQDSGYAEDMDMDEMELEAIIKELEEEMEDEMSEELNNQLNSRLATGI